MFRRPPRAPFATRSDRSRGRLFREPESSTRTPFQRDRDRIIHSTAFRRLKHKTQVFVYHEGDHYRTRLTHSLEVSQIARTLCRCLGLDEDLGEALALAHDLGHTPFGHAGESALHGCMAPYGGFDHNAQTIRIVTSLERRYPEFDGLNLSWETLEGLAKHNGPVVDGRGSEGIPAALAEYDARHDLELDTWPGPEAQVAALSDDIAYNNHDIDDGLRAGLFAVGDLMDLPLVGPVIRGVRADYPDIEAARLIHETVRRLIGIMVEDVLAETGRRIALARPADVVAVRGLGGGLVGFSPELAEADRVVKAFLTDHMYRHERVVRMTSRAQDVVRDLFALYLGAPERLPDEWRADAQEAGDKAALARVVADYIAGMTDRYAFDEHARLYVLESAEI